MKNSQNREFWRSRTKNVTQVAKTQIDQIAFNNGKLYVIIIKTTQTLRVCNKQLSMVANWKFLRVCFKGGNLCKKVCSILKHM